MASRNYSRFAVSNRCDHEWTQHTKLVGGGPIPPDAPGFDGTEPDSRGTHQAAIFKKSSPNAAVVPSRPPPANTVMLALHERAQIASREVQG